MQNLIQILYDFIKFLSIIFVIEIPNENKDPGLIKVFFYGTLKRNEPNADHLLNRNVVFVSEAITLYKYPLIIASEFNLPFLLNMKGYGKNVYGELFVIDKEAKTYFDEFEGVNEDLYSVEKIEVINLKTNKTELVNSYLLNDFRKDLLGEKTIFFENYSSKNDFFDEYKKSEDTPENLEKLIDSVKAKKT